MTAPSLADLPLQAQFAETERWTAETMRAHQFRQLGILAAHALRTTPFHRARLAAAGITGPDDAARKWHRLPLLRREEIQREAGLRSASLPEGLGAVIETTTSGSTGTPVTVLSTALEARFCKALELRSMLW